MPINFIAYFENSVKDVLDNFELISGKKKKVCVAVSGGKDSLATIYVLKKLGYNVSALSIDEGIANYRDSTISDLRGFCQLNKINLVVKSFEDEFPNFTSPVCAINPSITL